MSTVRSHFTPHAARMPRTSAGVVWWWLPYVAFVIYGSLLPFEFRPLPGDLAWARFLQIQLLDVGAQGRADWIANGVLYVPVGFLTFNLLAGGRSGQRLPVHVVAALAFSCLLAACVEFAQVYFPNRTVSLNDLYAEWIGSALGVALARRWQDRFWTLLSSWNQIRPERLLTLLLEAYAALYFAFAFFPFDLILSGAEMASKLRSAAWGWLVADEFRTGGMLLATLKLLAEALALIPLGVLFARLRRQVTGTQAALAGLALGAVIEIIQLFLVSGVSQGASLLTRAVGIHLGARWWTARARFELPRVAGFVHRYARPLLFVYLLLLAAVNGWFSYPWGDLAAAAQVFQETRFLLFYYHYYTTEQAALLSLVAIACMYAPVGAFSWIVRTSPAAAFWVALALCAAFETSKLFLQGLHPDPSNLPIAGLAAWGLARSIAHFEAALGRLSAESSQRGGAGEAIGGTAMAARHQGGEQAAALARTVGAGPALLSALGLAALIWLVWDFPVFSLALAALLATNGFLLWFRPHWILVVIPIAAALLDLAPWTGRFFIDEFDLFMASSLGIVYLRTRGQPAAAAKKDVTFLLALSLLGISYAVSAFAGLFPWKPVDLNSFAHYYSQFNGLRLAKGMLWALLFHGLLSRFIAVGKPVLSLMAQGMMIALAGVVLVTLWERMVFPGLFNFADEYRVTGAFSQMHLGGADLEAFLSLSVPFLVYGIFKQRRAWAKFGLLLLLAGCTYSLMVTFARVGYLGYAVAVGLAALGMFAGTTAAPAMLRRLTLAGLLALIVAGVAAPVMLGSFAQVRLAAAGSDLKIRQAHWADALAMRDAGWTTSLFGMGLGRFPETHYWRSMEPRSGSYALVPEEDNVFLRLGQGQPLFIEQVIAPRPDGSYSLQLLLRSTAKDPAITLALCEKWLLSSAGCSSQTISFPGNGRWQAFNLAFPSLQGGSAGGRPTKFSLFNASTDSPLEVDELALLDESGRNLLSNGNFQQGLDHWFFVPDDALAWNISSMPVHLLFEQGWIGLIAFALFAGGGLARAIVQTWCGNASAAVVLASAAGLLVIATMDTLIDSPRLLFLLMAVLLLCWRSRALDSSRLAETRVP